MGYASYERQQLSLYAAGFINGLGTTSQGYGCQLTRLGTGVYAVVFGADSGLVSDESYTTVSAKYDLGSSAGVACIVGIEDTSNLVKTIFTRGLTNNATGVLTLLLSNTDIEVSVYRTVTH